MKTVTWNKADKVLAGAGAAFLLSLYAVSKSPDNDFLQGVHFCTEAALVGGIADWFAVTALFEKPWGFPYHTAILPKRRQEFMNAMVQLIQQEFFSHRKIFSLLENMNLCQQAVNWLTGDEIMATVRVMLHEKLEQEIQELDFTQTVNYLAEDIRQGIKAIPATAALKWLCKQAEGERGSSFLRELGAYLLVKVDTPEMRSNILAFLEKYQQEKTQSQGMMAQFLSGLASAMGVLNLEEATDIIQKNLIRLCENISAVNSAEHQEIKEAVLQELKCLRDSSLFDKAFCDLKERLADSLPLEKFLSGSLEEIKKTTQLAVSSENKKLMVVQENNPAGILEDYLLENILQLPEHFSYNGALKECFDDLLHDASSRCLLYAREMSEQIVRTVLGELSDEKLNQLVYEKVEPDMLWIRMNGSIVGSIVGLIIFIALKAVASI